MWASSVGGNRKAAEPGPDELRNQAAGSSARVDSRVFRCLAAIALTMRACLSGRSGGWASSQGADV
eukprot:870077-Alexandrium_andersonii.AAC.1